MRGHTDRAEAEMAVHVAALTKPVGELIEAVLRKHHRAVLEAVKELHERCAKAERERDAARDSLSRLQQVWAENVPAVKYKQERDAAREALRQILGWRELRSGANEIPIERIEDIARAILEAKP